MRSFRRPHAAELARRLAEPRRFLQVVTGARQVGKIKPARRLLLGGDGIAVDEFLLEPVSHWVAT